MTLYVFGIQWQVLREWQENNVQFMDEFAA